MRKSQSQTCVCMSCHYSSTHPDAKLLTLGSTSVALSLYPCSQLRGVYTCLCHQAEPRLFVYVNLIRLQTAMPFSSCAVTRDFHHYTSTPIFSLSTPPTSSVLWRLSPLNISQRCGASCDSSDIDISWLEFKSTVECDVKSTVSNTAIERAVKQKMLLFFIQESSTTCMLQCRHRCCSLNE